jgi:tetratricopeptide (TPR) repeat protein
MRPWRAAVALVVLSAVVAAPYVPWLSNGFVYDDLVLIVDKPAPTSPAALFSVFTKLYHPSGLPYYRPLSGLTLSVQKALFGNQPLPYHLFNLLLVVAVALLARALLVALGARPLAAMAFAALFALHPIVSSVVYSIGGRETLLMLIFSLGALWAFVRGGRLLTALAMTLFATALLCKEHAIALPLLFWLADALGLSADAPVKHPAPGRAARALTWAWRYAPVLLIVALYFVVRTEVLGGAGGRAKGLELAILHDPKGPLLSLLYSIQTIFVPTVDLNYEPRLPAWWSTWRLLVALGALGGLGLLASFHGKPRKRALLFWGGWALATLLPSANILAQETRFDDRYVVLPLLGLVGAAATLAGELWTRERARAWLAGTVGITVLGLGLISHHRGEAFADDSRFLTRWTQSDPSSHQAQASLAEHFQRQRRYAEALPHARAALDRVHANMPEPLCIKLHFALANLYTLLGRHPEAAAQYEKILRMKPSYAGARRLLERARRRASTPARAGATASGEIGARLLPRLRASGQHGRPIWFGATTADPRSLQLERELQDIFRQAGWEIRGTQHVPFILKRGLFLFVAGAQTPAFVTALRRSLEDSGLPITTLATGYREYARDMTRRNPTWRGFALGPDQTYILVVGPPGR